MHISSLQSKRLLGREHEAPKFDADPGLTTSSSDGPEPEANYVVVYALMVDSKEDGIYMRDVCFGGVGCDMNEAKSVAKDCVNKIKGGVVLPKIILATTKPRVLSAMQEAVKHFTKMELQMIEAEEVMASTDKRRRKH